MQSSSGTAASACVLIRAIAVLLVAAATACASSSVHKTIQIPDGSVIDCVDIHQQPALKHAPPGRRQIQAKPKRNMKAIAAAASVSKREERPQAWRKHGSCPPGTVPIRRASRHANTEVADLARRTSPFRRRRHAAAATAGAYSNFSTLDDASNVKVEMAVAYATNALYLGARADVPYWKVNVHPNEYSMNYILIGNTIDPQYDPTPGGYPPANLTNQIAVGLVTWPAFYGDSLSRLFVFYTADGGWGKVCFNLECGGFHLQESEYALGDYWTDDSQVGGETNYVTLGIHRDPSLMNWWVTVMDTEIGYYPEDIFNTMFTEAVYVEMGGQVLDTRPGGNHTTTPMGNGIPSCAGSRFAASIMEYLGVDANGNLFNDEADTTITTTPSCYGANPLGFNTNNYGYNFAYGGPGGIYCDKTE
ncbi:unnamed protein product [Urochloa decumbens]|uniref:Neprosin PEP catalytic domain-containing protein n=1 Tax=Urochloa decumbens TaxID=240449 RepID=A0ABC9DVH7_9POAL